MKTVKIICGNLNNSYAELPPTSQDIGGRLRSLKKDGTFIEGRMPLNEEETVLWRYALTSKQKVGKNDTQLYATIYVPEEGVDNIDNENRKKIGLFKHIMEHQNVCYFKTVIEGGTAVKKQVNKNYRRNPMFYFELIDETAIEEKKYLDSRLETKYRGVIDEMYDKSEGNDGEWLEMCYGLGIVKPERNTKRQNYNLVVNKLQINPENFKLYYEDVDRAMVNIIRKAERMENPTTGEPYITSNEINLSFFNGVAIGRGIDEMKVHFRQHKEEFDYLITVTQPKKVEPTYEDNRPPTTPKPFTPTTQTPEVVGADNKTLAEHRVIAMEVGKLTTKMKKAKAKNDNKEIQETLEQLAKAREKYAKNLDYFNNKLQQTATDKGVAMEI